MDPARIELATLRCKRSVLPLDYGPLKDFLSSWFIKVTVRYARIEM